MRDNSLAGIMMGAHPDREAVTYGAAKQRAWRPAAALAVPDPDPI